MSPFKIFRYKVRFLTPAFLGDSEKSGQWRVPPFKEQLRYWWRVCYASEHAFNVNVQEMRRAEGMLFGNAWLQEGATKSLVQMRLSQWQKGRLTSWKIVKNKIRHPEVKFPIQSDLYLGYGPLKTVKMNDQWVTTLSESASINAGEEATLSLYFIEEDANRLEEVLSLMHYYGAIGGSSRNGWGSYELLPEKGEPPIKNDLNRFFRNWKDALQLDWPHAIGRDDRGPLVWCTGSCNNWQDVIRDLAIIKVGIRTQFVFQHGGTQNPEDRHWLAYPVTKHKVFSWENNTTGRLPNTLRFVVKRTQDNRLRGVIFHMPCSPPDEFMPDLDALRNVWQKVHQLLDELTNPVAQRRYEMIDDAQRRDQLRPELHNITLHRGQGG